MTESFLDWADGSGDQYRLSTILNRIESFYVGDGWYSDGPKFHMDYYNSWVIHSMLVDVLATQKLVAERKKQNTKPIQDRYDQALKRMRRYAEFNELLEPIQARCRKAQGELFGEATWQGLRLIWAHDPERAAEQREVDRAQVADMSERDLAKEIKRLEKQMMEHARNLEFENAARVRDQLATLREQAFGGAGHDKL